MKKAILIIVSLMLLSAACTKTELKTEIPSSPQESYMELPK